MLSTRRDTGNVIIMGKKASARPAAAMKLPGRRGTTPIPDNLRYSLAEPLDMYKEVNTGTNLPAQIDLGSVDGEEYEAPAHGERRRFRQQETYLYRETKALINAGEAEKLPARRCALSAPPKIRPPYHIAFQDLCGTSAEATLEYQPARPIITTVC